MARCRADRSKARALYVFERKSLVTIAQELGVSSATVGRWKASAAAEGDNWQLARSAHLVAGDGLEAIFAMVVEDFAIFAQATMNDLKADKDIDAANRAATLVKLADAMTKTAAATRNLSPKLSELGIAQDVLSRLLDYVRKHHPEHANAMLAVLEPFGHELAKVYG